MARFSLEGETLGKYQILEPLGSGGMSRVYRAYHAQLDRYVAVKVLRSDLVEDETFTARFRREAQSVAALRHPNIVQVYDFDIQEDLTYMVMELLDGDSLKTRLNDYRVRSEPMPLGEMIHILLDILDGLAYAHEMGMVHRDIKPANILLTRRGQAVLADFGIAQIVGQTRHTMSGALMGTLAYIAPEQGLKGECDARSDLYSLGIVLYEMLTQHPPYDADTPLAILMKHLNDPLPLPSEGETAVPVAFERVLLKALAKQPEDRYQTATEMADALQQVAAQLRIELPAQISPPLSFTTRESPSESIAVASGQDRQKLARLPFAADVTDPVLGNKLKEELMTYKSPTLLNRLERVGNRFPRAGRFFDSIQEQAEWSQTSLTKVILNSIFIFIAGNFVITSIIGIFDAWNIYDRIWPYNFFLISWGLALILRYTGAPAMLIPTGFMFGNALLLSFYALTDNWNLWDRLWPLEPLLIIWVITTALRLRDNHVHPEKWLNGFAAKVGRVSLIASLVVVFLGMISSL